VNCSAASSASAIVLSSPLPRLAPSIPLPAKASCSSCDCARFVSLLLRSFIPSQKHVGPSPAYGGCSRWGPRRKARTESKSFQVGPGICETCGSGWQLTGERSRAGICVPEVHTTGGGCGGKDGGHMYVSETKIIFFCKIHIHM